MTFRRARLQFNQRNVGFTLTQKGPCRKRNRPYLRSLKNGILPVCPQFPVSGPVSEHGAICAVLVRIADRQGRSG